MLILLFLGSWRSTLIITISIPLSILASICCLSALGETINIMTLGGLALAVGILVDDATVTIENINYHLEQGKDVETAILDGAHQIALPALVSTLSICIVFVPMFLLAGIAKFLFIPLGRSGRVRDAGLLHPVANPGADAGEILAQDSTTPARKQARGTFWRAFKMRFERGFESMRDRYHALLGDGAATAARALPPYSWARWLPPPLLAFPLGPLPGLGQDFFPVRRRRPDQAAFARAYRYANRGDRGALRCDRGDDPRGDAAKDQIAAIVDNLGLPYSGINLAYSTSAPVGPGDADIFVNLNEDHEPTAQLRPRPAHQTCGRLSHRRRLRFCRRT